MTAAAQPATAYQPHHERLPQPALKGVAALLLVGACALAPYVTWRLHPDYLFTISDLLFSLAAILLVGERRLNLRPFGDMTLLWMIGIFAMLLGFLIGSIAHSAPIRWMIVAGQYGFAFVVLPSLLVLDRIETTIWQARALILGVLAMEMFGIFVYYVVDPSYTLSQQISHEFITGGRRLGGFMADANWNAAMIATTIPFILYLSRTGRLRGLWAYSAVAILCWGLMLSGSFTGFTGTALAVMIFLLVSGGTHAVRMVIGLIALATMVFASGVSPPRVFEVRVQQALQEGNLQRAGTYSGRMELVKEAWGIVDKTALVGLGVDQYRVVSKDKAPVHNMVLLAWAEGGLLALLGWLLMLAVPFVISATALARDRAAAALGLSVLTAFSIFSMAAPHMYARSWVVPLVLAMAIILTRPRPHPTLSDDPKGVKATSKAPRSAARNSRILGA